MEVLLSMFVFLTILSGIIKLNGYLHTYSDKEVEREQMIYLASNLLEEYKSGINIQETVENLPFRADIKVVSKNDYLENVTITLYSKKHPKLNYVLSHDLTKRGVIKHE